MLTVDAALDILLPHACKHCGAKLPAPGEPCGACGELPPTTRAEMAEQLAGPVAPAKIEAARLMEEGHDLRAAASAKYAQADTAVHVAELTQARDAAVAALETALDREETLEPAVDRARIAERAARGELETAQAAHRKAARAEERARRTRRGPEAEAEALLRLRAADTVLARYSAKHDQAAAALHHAEQALAAAHTASMQANDAAVKAENALATPGRAPVSPHRLANDLMRLALGGELDEVEKALAKTFLSALTAHIGLDADIERRARQRLLAEQEDEKRARPVLAQRTADGQVAIVPNLLNPGTPMPFHPPAARP